jgi:hypothetical protein
MKSKATVLGPSIIILLAIVVMMTAAAPIVSAHASHVRWDILSVQFAPPGMPNTLFPGGIASATANDGSHITLTGSGTFVAPSRGSREGEDEGEGSHGVSGGGKWTTYSSKGDVTGTGTYEVTSLVLWEPSPLPPGNLPTPIDKVDPSDKPSTGLAVLRISYSDGEKGTLVVSCEGYLSPAFAYEGIHATKGLTDYKSPAAPVPGVNANRTLFHVEE